MNQEGLFNVALFPIPGCVSFPHTTVPLHVFEPRYRLMIEECVEKRMLLGVCHTKSIERFATKVFDEEAVDINNKDELHKFYKQNLSTFRPEDIFSAGTIDITQKTDDGRYAINVNMLKRFRILDLIQSDPYKIARCEEYQDTENLSFENGDEALSDQRDFIIHFLKEQMTKLGRDPNTLLLDLIDEPTVNKFTFKLFRYVRMQEHEMQKVLNSRNPAERLSCLYDFLVNLQV